MNSEYEKRLEAAIERELKRLPELPAPQTLISRVMSSIASQAALPWYRQSWVMWPMPLRAVSLVVLVAISGAICFASWKLTQAESFLAVIHQINGWFAGANSLWNALNAVLGVGLMLIKKLGTGFIIATLLAVAMGYAMCIGLGTVYVRLAFGRR
jgi:hypothetical protein